ncbi:MAG: peptidylprolyl isomerase [Candidatus Methanomethylophilus sp.]|nr:peptidylprolyl isomerase [Methanomethylophilus sp.]MDD4222464.1 peptidylprolyl isomerase [Methanomethylophilus sp.]MDD4668999.1 peptidylprolyl isomerase [Methanomethylophilus sp.]
MVKEVHAAHILVKNEELAKKIKADIAAGKNFGELAKKYSTCPSKKKGGDLGWFRRGQMVKEFENAAFAAKKGDIVGPVKTEFGWHVIKVLEQR